ncbi:MAG: (2Fe-2S) ferredoxin domain-containing protein [Candidatus Magasanikbacteria bacterium]|nr:(2Fe-2S) ferredoxin domain-containing protein [Candidatus Magasanikbacteria bacterium]
MPKKIRVCAGPHCSYRKSNRILDALRGYFSAESTAQDVDLDYGACTGFCEEGPNVVVDDETLCRHADTKTIGDDVSTGKGEKLYAARPLDLNLDDVILGI